MDESFSERLSSASAEADSKLAFYIHASAYLGVNALLIVINLYGASHHFWAKWPLILWGMLLAFHIIHVFRSAHQKRGNIKKDMLKKELSGF